MIAAWFLSGFAIAAVVNTIHRWAVVPVLREDGFDAFVGWFPVYQFEELAIYRKIRAQRGSSLLWFWAEVVFVVLGFIWFAASLCVWIDWSIE